MSAGHGPQLFFTAHSAVVDGYHADELPLGVEVPMKIGVAREFRCEPGDSLVLTTDGFFEWANFDSETYGTARMRDFFAAHHQLEPIEFIKALHDDVVTFSRGTKQADDLTAVVIK